MCVSLYCKLHFSKKEDIKRAIGILGWNFVLNAERIWREDCKRQCGVMKGRRALHLERSNLRFQLCHSLAGDLILLNLFFSSAEWGLQNQKRHKNSKGEKWSRATARADLFNDTKLSPLEMPLHIMHLKLNFKSSFTFSQGDSDSTSSISWFIFCLTSNFIIGYGTK